MSTSLLDVWEASAANPYYPAVPKERQFLVGATLLVLGLMLSSAFALNRSAVSLPLLGLPASIAFGFGAVYMICAAGVYV